MSSSHEVVFLNRKMIEELPVTPVEILDAVEKGVDAQARGDVILEPTVWIRPYDDGSGFATIRGAIPGEYLVGIKNVGTFQNNHTHGLPNDVGLMTLSDARTGVPKAILDGSPITTIRTAAMTALGAKYLARPNSKVLAYIGVRGIASWAIRFIDSFFDLDQIRIFSATPSSRHAGAETLDKVCRATVVAAESWKDCLERADIMVDGSSLRGDQVLFPSDVIGNGATVIAYGGFSSFDMKITETIDKIVMDRWQDYSPGMIGALGPQMKEGHLTSDTLHALLHEVISGRKPGRVSPDEKILFWHRGLGPCDITLANLYLAKAKEASAGIQLPYL